MKYLILAILLSLSLHGEEFYQQRDKQLHFAGSAVISAVSTEILIERGFSKKEAILYSIVGALLVGLAKEAYDEYSYGGASIEDFGADALGAIGGVMPRLTYTWEF